MEKIKNQKFAGDIGFALVDFSKTGERGTLSRRLHITKCNYDSKQYNRIVRNVKKNLFGTGKRRF